MSLYFEYKSNKIQSALEDDPSQKVSFIRSSRENIV